MPEVAEDGKSPLDALADFASFIHGAASLIVGHRAILLESGMNPVVVDQCCYELHQYFLGGIATEVNFMYGEFEDLDEDDDDG